MTRRARELSISLGDVPVGTLRLLEDERSEFAFLDSYQNLPERPVLGQFFEDDLRRAYQSRMRLTPFFSNLLPEGALRELLAKRAGVHPEREFFLLQELEEDLPGAVRVRGTGEPVEPGPSPPLSDPGPTLESGLRFSLAGVQLKFSMIGTGRGLTIPMRGEGGDWIVKLPDSRFPGVPENEFVVMTWARSVGLDVPDVKLFDLSELENLPEEVRGLKGRAYAVRRFDRAGGKRIHMEDFAQVLGRYAHDKYEGASYESLGRLLLSLGGSPAFEDYLRRLVFMVLVGNTDAHLKNWSLLYPDGQRAVLSPAYDLVAVVAFLPDQKLGLSLGGSKRFEDVSFESFRRLASRAQVDQAWALAAIREFRDRVLSVLHGRQGDPDSAALASRLIADHLPRIPLASQR